jgi:ribose transport system ATP-binding protein
VPEACLVELLHISKSFRATRALRDVSFQVKRGEVHALVGENGAGKSTLMKILSGVHRMDEGTIRVEGRPVEIPDPHAGKQLGIGIIYQELALIPDLTVAENIFIGDLSARFGLIDWRELNRKAGESLAEMGFSQIDPRSRIADLGVAHRQIVEIAKGISENVKVMILDEPTAVLAPRDVDRLFVVLRKLRDRGVGLVYISHRLDEIFRIADRITVLKDGAVVRTVNATEIGQEQLIGWMIGRTIETLFPEKGYVPGPEVLRVDGLRAGKVHDVSFTVRAGEIFGIAGLVGSGRTELLRAIFGADPVEDGTVTLAGRKLRIRNPRDAVRAGMALVPEDRKQHGLVLSMAIRDNLTLPSLGRMAGALGVIHRQTEASLAESLVSRLRIRAGSIEAEAADLSGGNQQKVVLAKWLGTDAKVLLLDEPTRGVDVGARMEIYHLIRELAAAGMGIVVASSDTMEVIGLCDRVGVMSHGTLTGVLEGAKIGEENIMRLAVRRPAAAIHGGDS